MLTITRETRDQQLHRLAAEARSRDLRIFESIDTGEFYCSSATMPDMAWRVTLVSCSCPHFVRDGVCKHHAHLLWHLGELPADTPDPDPAPAVICSECDNVMDHVAGVTFACKTCGREFVVDEEVADKIEQRLCEVSLIDPDAIFSIERMLSPGGDRCPAGLDPDHRPSREDVATGLGLFWASANEIAGVLNWQRDRQDVLDRLVA